jgi:hypothetical protein
MNFIHGIKIKILVAAVGSFLLLSCTTNNTVEPTVKRKLISAKTYIHPSKKSYHDELKLCKKAVAKKQVDNCMSKKGWEVKVKRFD